MSITVFLEIIIGVIFVWFFLALAVMAIQEWWASFSKARAADLQKTIRAMLEDPDQYNKAQVEINSIVGQLYQHPLIQSLSEPLRNQSQATASENSSKKFWSNLGKRWSDWRERQKIQQKPGESSIQRWLPSYIPTRIFSLALFDVITTANTQNSVIQEALNSWQTAVQESFESLRQDGKLPDDLTPELDAAIVELKEVAQPFLNPTQLLNDLEIKVGQIKADNPELAEALSALREKIEAGKLPHQVTLEDWSAKIEGWLDQVTVPGTESAAGEIVKSFTAKAQSHLAEAELLNHLQLKVAQLKTMKPKLTAALTELKPMIDQLPRYLSSQEVVKGMVKLADNYPGAARTLVDIQKRALSMAKQGEDAIAAFHTTAANWFDGTMERASKWYGQKARKLSFVFGIIVAVVLNIDTFAVATALYKQPVLRAQVLAQAESISETPQAGTDPGEVGATLQDLGLPVGWSFLDKTECATVPAGNRWIPLGTRCIVPGDTPKGIEVASVGEGLVFILLKLAGWLLSGAMAAQGAPFWFDIMKKLVNVRSSGSSSS